MRFHLQQQLDERRQHHIPLMAFDAQIREAFTTWQTRFRDAVKDCLGMRDFSLPQAVHAELIQSVEYPLYTEEKYALTAGTRLMPMVLLVPQSAPPYKAILALHGHDPGVQYILGHYPDAETEARLLAVDSNFAQALAQAGYLVCAIEQQGFGERVTDQIADNPSQSSCRHLAHAYLMEGRTLLGERCLDAMVAVSYLAQRDDVTAIGCTGHSGGGTTALWTSALDERIQAAVISCYFCSFHYSILGMPHCECNYVPRILQYGDVGDLAALIAPRPLRIIAGQHDPIFPIEGVYQAYKTLQKAYALHDAPCSLTVHEGEHAYHHTHSQEWFAEHL